MPRIALKLTATCLILASTRSTSQTTLDMVPACLAASRLKGSYGGASEAESARIIVVGDIHGDSIGLHEILFTANITSSRDLCQWKNPERATISAKLTVVQMGDVVDRGPGTMSAWSCLQNLQRTSPRGVDVIRLVGNHELWWLEGSLHMRNKNYDTPTVTSTIIHDMKHGILNNEIMGAYAHRSSGLPLFFIHAGLRPSMLSLLESEIKSKATTRPKPLFNSAPDIDELALHVNDRLKSAVENCATNDTKCHFRDPIFQAGPERGGTAIGGPFWTDFKVLQEQAREAPSLLTSFVQIVGHSIQTDGIAVTEHMQAVCVDVGMYLGGRAFLEITPNGHFRAYEQVQTLRKKKKSSSFNQRKDLVPIGDGWFRRDLTSMVCDSTRY